MSGRRAPTCGRARAWPLLAVVGTWIALSLGFQRATPALEASDEARHFGFVAWLAERGTLPVADPRRPTLARQEAAQPPLYYLLGAALVGFLDTSDAAAFYSPRPGSPIGRADLPGPRQMFLAPHQPTGGQSVLAIRLLRLFSMALGAATIVAAWATVRAIEPTSTGLGDQPPPRLAGPADVPLALRHRSAGGAQHRRLETAPPPSGRARRLRLPPGDGGLGRGLDHPRRLRPLRRGLSHGPPLPAGGAVVVSAAHSVAWRRDR